MIATTADREHDELCLADLSGKQHRPLEKIVSAAGHAEQAWQLGHRDGQSRAGLEAHQDAVADQLYERTQPQQPGNQAENRHGEAGKAGDLRIALHVAARHFPDGARNHQRYG